jgi:hypothetical protein
MVLCEDPQPLQKIHVSLPLPAIGTLHQIGDIFGCGDRKSSAKALPLRHFEPSQRQGIIPDENIDCNHDWQEFETSEEDFMGKWYCCTPCAVSANRKHVRK